MSTFVSVGNAVQRFDRLLDAVCRIATQLPQPVFVQFGSAEGFSCPACQCEAFLEMSEFEWRVGEAELLIMHAGAGSVIHAVRQGKIPVVIPRRTRYGEIIDDHQMEFAAALERTGKIVVALEKEDLPGAIAEALHRQSVNGEESNVSPMIRLVAKSLSGYARMS